MSEVDRWTYYEVVKDAVKRTTPLMSHHQRSRIVDEVCLMIAQSETRPEKVGESLDLGLSGT